MRFSYEETDSDLHRSSLLKKRNYSHCPLKKRPVHFIKDYDEDESHFKRIIKNGKFHIQLLFYIIYFFYAKNNFIDSTEFINFI